MYVHNYTHTHSIAVMQADLFRNCYYRGGNIEAMGDGRDGKGSSCSRYSIGLHAEGPQIGPRPPDDLQRTHVREVCPLLVMSGCLGKKVVHMQPFRMRLLPPALALLLPLVL